jgi:hypothetical protein
LTGEESIVQDPVPIVHRKQSEGISGQPNALKNILAQVFILDESIKFFTNKICIDRHH